MFLIFILFYKLKMALKRNLQKFHGRTSCKFQLGFPLPTLAAKIPFLVSVETWLPILAKTCQPSFCQNWIWNLAVNIGSQNFTPTENILKFRGNSSWNFRGVLTRNLFTWAWIVQWRRVNLRIVKIEAKH